MFSRAAHAAIERFSSPDSDFLFTPPQAAAPATRFQGAATGGSTDVKRRLASTGRSRASDDSPQQEYSRLLKDALEVVADIHSALERSGASGSSEESEGGGGPSSISSGGADSDLNAPAQPSSAAGAEELPGASELVDISAADSNSRRSGSNGRQRTITADTGVLMRGRGGPSREQKMASTVATAANAAVTSSASHSLQEQASMIDSATHSALKEQQRLDQLKQSLGNTLPLPASSRVAASAASTARTATRGERGEPQRGDDLLFSAPPPPPMEMEEGEGSGKSDKAFPSSARQQGEEPMREGGAEEEEEEQMQRSYEQAQQQQRPPLTSTPRAPTTAAATTTATTASATGPRRGERMTLSELKAPYHHHFLSTTSDRPLSLSEIRRLQEEAEEARAAAHYDADFDASFASSAQARSPAIAYRAPPQDDDRESSNPTKQATLASASASASPKRPPPQNNQKHPKPQPQPKLSQSMAAALLVPQALPAPLPPSLPMPDLLYPCQQVAEILAGLHQGIDRLRKVRVSSSLNGNGDGEAFFASFMPRPSLAVPPSPPSPLHYHYDRFDGPGFVPSSLSSLSSLPAPPLPPLLSSATLSSASSWNSNPYLAQL